MIALNTITKQSDARMADASQNIVKASTSKRSAKDQRDGESFVAWQTRLQHMRDLARERKRKERQVNKQTITDAASVIMSHRTAERNAAISATDGAKGMDCVSVAPEIDKRTAVDTAMALLGDKISLGYRERSDVHASLTEHFRNGFSKSNRKSYDLTETKLNRMISNMELYASMGTANFKRARPIYTEGKGIFAGTMIVHGYVPDGVAADPMRTVVAPAPMRLKSAKVRSLVTESHTEVRDKDGRVTDIRKVEVCRIFGDTVQTPATSYAHTPNAGASNVEVFTQAERLESRETKAERANHSKYVDIDTERASHRQFRCYPIRRKTTSEGYLYTEVGYSVVRQLVPTDLTPVTPKVRSWTLKQYAQYALARTSEGYVYSVFPRPERTKQYNHVSVAEKQAALYTEMTELAMARAAYAS